MKLFIAAALAASCLFSSAPAFANDGDPEVMKGFESDVQKCVPVSALKSVAKVTDLTPEQFQFVRAILVAIPPVSRMLPPGDRAVMVRSGDTVIFALVADDQACGRFLAPDFIQTMVIQVGEGTTISLGAPL
jgi:hypothetical protein